MQAYRFETQVAQAREQEQLLDRFFASQGIDVQQVTHQAQKMGIDRYFRMPLQKTTVAVEYKSDFKADQTGNAFLELISQLRGERVDALGWVSTSGADWLAYHLPRKGRVIVIEFAELRRRIPAWLSGGCRTRSIPNRGVNGRNPFVTVGALVTIHLLEQASVGVFEIEAARTI